MDIFTLNLTGSGWTTNTPANDSSLSLKGQIYRDDATIDVHELANELAMCKTTDQLSAFLPRLNGFYAWVEQSAGQIRAAVDQIRSRPLFYGLAEGRFYLSNNAEWVRQQVGDREMDPVAREEFQLAGFVTGADTLFPNVKQLQAGECLIARQTEAGPVVETHRYYRFLHQEPAESNEPDLRAELDRVTVRGMQRLIDYANGRQIVIPLSGGYDSRLIATMLKRLGYDNVLTFTYGVPGNKESVYSKRVADALGIRWHFVEYSESLWREAWQTSERWEYQRWASGWSSIAHLQDWLAVQKLKQGGVVEADAIFVPGHTGDFISGGHIPSVTFERASFSPGDVGEEVQKKHYTLAPMKLFSIPPAQWTQRISERAEIRRCAEPWEFSSACEKWEWQERQTKFICNSVRVYEFYDYDWWMPLWDLEFIRFWEGVPLALRKGREWHVDYVQYQFQQSAMAKEKLLRNASDAPAVISAIKRLHARFPLPNATRLIFHALRRVLRKKTIHLTEVCYVTKELERLRKIGYSSSGITQYFFLQDRQVVPSETR